MSRATGAKYGPPPGGAGHEHEHVLGARPPDLDDLDLVQRGRSPRSRVAVQRHHARGRRGGVRAGGGQEGDGAGEKRDPGQTHPAQPMTTLDSDGADHPRGARQRASALPRRRAGNPGDDDPGGLRRGCAHRASGGERRRPFPRAPGVQGRRAVRRLPQGQRDRRADGRVAERLHLARPRRLPHHLPRRARDGGAGPADRLRRAPAHRRRRARPRARRRDPGDQPRLRPAVDRRRVPDRSRRLRRAPARPPRARPRGAPAHLLARGDRRVPRAPLGRRQRRRLHRRQPRPRRGQRPDRRLPGALPDAARPGRASSPRPRRRPSGWSSSATPTSRTCACSTRRRSTCTTAPSAPR